MTDIDPDENYFTNVCPNENQSIYCSLADFNKKFTETNFFTLFTINIRSFFRNFDSLVGFLESLRKFPELLVLSETWLTKLDVEFANIIGYESFHTLREGKRSGGVTIFCPPILKPHRIDELCLSNLHIESCCVRVQYGGESLFLVGIYRPVSGLSTEFFNYITFTLQHDKLRYKKVVLTGDINIDLLSENSYTSDFVCLMQSYHFVPGILKPTRFPVSNNYHSPSLLDHAWLNFLETFQSGIIWADISDHCPVFLRILLPDSLSDKVTYDFRPRDQKKVAGFLSELGGTNWDHIINEDLNTNFIKFSNFLDKLYCKYFPKVKKTISGKRLKNPWITPGILRSIRMKSRYFKLYKMGIISREFNNSYRNLLNKVIKKAKQQFYVNSFNFSAGNVKNTWKVIKKVLNTKPRVGVKSLKVDGSIEEDPKLIAECFNNFFSSIASTLEQTIPTSDDSPLRYISNANFNSFFLAPTSTDECVKIIGGLKNSKGGMDQLPVWLWKEAKYLLAYPLSLLINKCMSDGEFPNCLKCAIITPVHKDGNIDDVNNFRPISILPTIGKIIEKVIVVRMLKFCDRNSILADEQFGFRPKRSTIDAVSTLIEHVYDSLNNKSSTFSLFIDIKKLLIPFIIVYYLKN